MGKPRFEVWSDTAYLSTGKILGILSDVIRASERIEVNGPESLNIEIPSTADALIAGDRVIRVVEDNGAWMEWRVDKITRTRSLSGVHTSIDALGIKSDMARFSPIVTQLQANAERWTHIEWVGLLSTELWEAEWQAFSDDTDIPSYFTKGVVGGSTAREWDLVLDWETQGSAIQELATVIGLEVELVAGATGYTVNLSTGINSTVFAPMVAFRKNERGIKYVEDHGKVGTRIYPRALGENAYKPTIGDMFANFQFQGGPTNEALGQIKTSETNQLKGLYLESVSDSTRRMEILTSSVLPSGYTSYISVSTADVYKIGSRDDWYIRDSSTGRRLIYIPRASTAGARLRSIILDRPDIPAITNVMVGGVNPGLFMAPVTSGGATQFLIGRESPYVHNGDGTSHVFLPSTAASITYTRVVRGDISQDRPHLSMQTHFYLVSGTVGVEMRIYNSSGGSVTFPSSTAGGVNTARASAANTWHDIAIAPGAIDLFQLLGGGLTVETKFKGLSTGTELYVDAIQVVNSPVPAEQIVDGAAPVKLWNAAMEMLVEGVDQPAKIYDVQAVDLGRIDSVSYPSEAFLPGGRVVLFDPGIGIADTRRIKARRRNLLIEGETVLELFDA